MKFFESVKKTFSLDYHSLALYRFLIGLVVMADVLYRWEDISHFYTDQGLLPRSIFLSELSLPWSFSLHLASGSEMIMILFFILHLIFGAMLVFGYKTRWAMLGAFIMTVSVHNRNWMVNNGGDDVLRAILFISIFLPLNKCFSIDSALKKNKTESPDSLSTGFLSTWGLVFFLQAFVIYFVSYILKDSDIWRKDFTAHFFSSRLDIFATSLGIWLRDFPMVGKIITAFSIYLEWLGPLLLIFSFLFGRHWWKVRTLIVATFIVFHFSIFLTMNIGLFTFICEAMWMVFIPTPFWEKTIQYFKKKKFHELVIYFDEECRFCEKSVRLFKEFFLLGEVKLLPAQKNERILRDMKQHNSWVVVNPMGEQFYKYSAFLEILRYSPHGRFFLFIFSLRPIQWIGEKIYFWISNHRMIMGTFTQYLDLKEPKKDIPLLHSFSELLGVFFFLTILMWNLTTIKKFEFQAPAFQSVTRWFHLYQEWNMFAPYPKMDNIWVEVPAVLSDGSEIELITGDRDIYSIKDQAFYRAVPNEHWRKFYLNLSDKVDYARYYGGFLCRQWNDRKNQEPKKAALKNFEVIVYSQLNLPSGEKGGISRKLSWKHWCFEEDYKKVKSGSSSN